MRRFLTLISIETAILLSVMCPTGGGTAGAEAPQVLDIPSLPEIRATGSNSGAKKLRNPFAWALGRGRQKHSTVRQKAFTLEAIMWNEHHPLALVSGKLVEEGDAIGDGMVMAIYKDRVIIKRFDGTEQELRMKNDFLEVFGQ